MGWKTLFILEISHGEKLVEIASDTNHYTYRKIYILDKHLINI